MSHFQPDTILEEESVERKTPEKITPKGGTDNGGQIPIQLEEGNQLSVGKENNLEEENLVGDREDGEQPTAVSEHLLYLQLVCSKLLL